MAGSIVGRLMAYNSITKDELFIGSYNSFEKVWTPNIAGDITLVFWEEPDSDLKAWLQANATKLQ